MFGSNREEHDTRLRAFLKRMSDLGLTLNTDKCKFGMNKISYVGYNISDERVPVSDKKVRSIVEVRVPKDVAELRSCLGLVNFVGKFLPDLSTHAEPSYRLIKTPKSQTLKGDKFKWGEEQQAAFIRIKAMMARSKTLA